MIAMFIALVHAGPVSVGKFAGSGEVPAPWRVVKVGSARPTAYSLARVGNEPAVEARVASSMALLARPITVDLAQTPILCWRWLVSGVVAKGNMRKKSGNDFAARIYVAFDMPDSALDGPTKLRLKFARKFVNPNLPDAAITYVWDNRHPIGTAMKSPFTNRQQLIVAETGGARAGSWVSERANVANDFARAFGGKPGRAIQLAVASDGDNTKSSGRAAFGNIYFVAPSQECPA